MSKCDICGTTAIDHTNLNCQLNVLAFKKKKPNNKHDLVKMLRSMGCTVREVQELMNMSSTSVVDYYSKKK